MNTSEPEGWSFSNTKFKIYESGLSSSDDSSDDEDLFQNQIYKKKNLKSGREGGTLTRIIFPGYCI